MPEGVDDLSLHGPDYEVRAQLKSRHDPQATFAIKEIAGFIAKAAHDLPDDWTTNSRISLALILERPVSGVVETGFSETLGQSGQDISVLAAQLATALPTGFPVASLLARTHIVVEPQPIDRAVAALVGSTLEPAALNVVAQLLREAAGKAADDNFSAASSAIAALGRSDVQSKIDSVQSLFDPDAYLTLTAGLAEMADFARPVQSEGFYEGVNTSPGHVGAGLVFERPEAMADVLSALEGRRVALIAGPSGSGKSALAWLAAHHSRHAIRWYRVRRLLLDDVGKLAALARRLDATPARPVGFVVDDAGRDDTAGWDMMVREVDANPGILLVGTVREEDVFTLETASRTTTLRPVLDEVLAERVWAALSAAEQSTFGHWREPFDLSLGLLLEYVHLLTAGRRLAETIHEQVRRRLAEERGVELAVLRVVAFASANGGAVDAEKLRAREGVDPIKFAKAMQRLIDEHAVRLRPDGSISGLHEIRSRHLDEALQSLLGEEREAAVAGAVATITPDTVAAFIQRTLQQWPEAAEALFDGLVARLQQADPATWVAVFHGLGLATVDQVAVRWLDISREAEIEDRLTGTMFGLVMADSDMGDVELFAGLKKAQAAFKSVQVTDLRQVVLDRLDPSISLPKLNLEQANELSAALLPLHGAVDPPSLTVSPESDLDDAALDPLIALLETLRERDVGLAEKVVEGAGGVEYLLSRLHQETPWATPPKLGEFEGEPAVLADLRYIHPETQPDIHAAAVKFSERMAALAPRAQRIVCDAIWPDGKPAGIGDYQIATLRLIRRAIPAPARVAWNRAQLRAITRLVATETETQRTGAIAKAIREVADWVREAGDFYCRNEVPGAYWKALLQISRLITSLVAPPAVEQTQTGPLSQGSLAGHDKLHGFVVGLQRLMTELTDGISAEPGLMAVRTSDLARDALALQDANLWRNTAEPPIAALVSLETTLWEIRAVLSDAAADAEGRRRAALRFSKMSRHNSALAKGAAEARCRADDEVAKTSEIIRTAFANRGLEVTVAAKPSEKNKGWRWPEVEYAALVPVESVFDFFPFEAIYIEVAKELDLASPLAFAPVIHGHVPPLALTFTISVLPDLEFGPKWEGNLPFPVLPDDEDRQLFDRGMDALVAVSATLMHRERDLIEAEETVQSGMFDRASKAIDVLSDMAVEREDELLAEAVGLLARAGRRIVEEASAPPGPDTLAVDAIGIVRVEVSEFGGELLAARLLLMERAAKQAAEDNGPTAAEPAL